MLVVSHVWKSFIDADVLADVSFAVNADEVVGLVGENGSGKTTLLRAIAGELDIDKGSISLVHEQVGYLPQHIQFDGKRVISFLNHELNHEMEWQIPMVLEQMNLADLPEDQLCDELSGGQKTRLGLATLLLNDPSPTLLLLDEPTNNLDIEGLDWLTHWLQSFEGAVLITSHDRRFLDDVCDRIIEIENGKVTAFGGGYSFYKEQKILQRMQQKEVYESYISEKKRLERLIALKKDRIKRLQQVKPRDNDKLTFNRAVEKTTHKVSGVKRALDSRLSHLQEIQKPHQRSTYDVSLEGATHRDKLIIAAEHVTKSFGSVEILRDVNFAVYGTERVWVQGQNGSGKTTLLRMLQGATSPDHRAIVYGNNVSIGYFSQDIIVEDDMQTGMYFLLSVGIPETVCFKEAKRLYLNPDDLKKPMSSLSRGQLSKLHFVKLLMSNFDCLILDEPTNHLEIDTREQIEDALMEYHGALIVATHDRWFGESIGLTKVVSPSD